MKERVERIDKRIPQPFKENFWRAYDPVRKHLPGIAGFWGSQGILLLTEGAKIVASHLDIHTGPTNFLLYNTGDFGDAFQAAAIGDIVAKGLLLPGELLSRKFDLPFSSTGPVARIIRRTAGTALGLGAVGVAEISSWSHNWAHSGIGEAISLLRQPLGVPDPKDILFGAIGVGAWLGINMYSTSKKRRHRFD